MKKKKVAIISIIGILVIAVVVLGVVQSNNIAAVKYRLAYTQEEIGELINANDNKINEIMNAVVAEKVRPLTGDEEKQLIEKIITIEMQLICWWMMRPAGR